MVVDLLNYEHYFDIFPNHVIHGLPRQSVFHLYPQSCQTVIYTFIFRFHQKGVPHPYGSVADNSWDNLRIPLLVSDKLFRLIISAITGNLLYYTKCKTLIPGF